MPRADMCTANAFMHLAQGLHGYGVLRLVAMLLHTQDVVHYAAFYQMLLAFYRTRTEMRLGQALVHVIQLYDNVDDMLLRMPDFSFGRMHEDQFLFAHAALNAERFFAEITPFLQQFGLDEHLLAQLLRYQRECVLLPGSPPEKILEFDYDFPAYFAAIYDGAPVPLAQKNIRVRLTHEYDLTKHEYYFDKIVRLARFSDNVFYRIDRLD
jgi:hypothetical protein